MNYITLYLELVYSIFGVGSKKKKINLFIFNGLKKDKRFRRSL